MRGSIDKAVFDVEQGVRTALFVRCTTVLCVRSHMFWFPKTFL